MPPIPNYTPDHENTQHYKWNHTNTDIEVVVEKNTKYSVYIYGLDTQPRQIAPLTSQKSTARSIAVTWMRSNPTPNE